MRFNDAVIGGVLFVLAIAIFLYARTLPAMPGQQYGAAVFPMLVAWGLGGCGLGLVAVGARRWEGAVYPTEWMRSWAAWGRLVATIALVLLYVFASDWLGFIPVSFLILLALFLMLGSRWWVAAAISVFVTIVIAKSFGTGLLVPLPRGLFWI